MLRRSLLPVRAADVGGRRGNPSGPQARRCDPGNRETTDDSRRLYASEVAPRCFRIDSEPAPGTWSGDLGQQLTLLERAQIAAMFSGFSKADVDRSTVTSNGGAVIADEWLIFANK